MIDSESILQEMRKDIKALREDITEIKIAAAKRDGRLYLVMAFFGAIGGAVMDVIRRKLLG